MQHATALSQLSLRKDPRNGQRRVLDEVEKTQNLNIKLPTGYGKTFTACAAYAIKQRQGINRVLWIFPTDAQLLQFEKDGPEDMLDADVIGPRQVIDLRFFTTQALVKHRRNEAQVFAITVQSLIASGGGAVVTDLMENCRWMVVVDEYHHYGIEKSWGKRVLRLNCESRLAMSATPFRKDDDSAFGKPDIEVLYTDAVAEGAVKPLIGHAYHYAIDAITEDGDIETYTTEDLVEMAGGDSPEKIEALCVTRKMRWSPKYVSPLVTVPVDRMISNRLHTGYHKLQAIFGAMCVSHAKLVCEQIKALYPELAVDWVGTGPDGRTDAENKSVLAKFCPQKVEGQREPTLDILVHVGMAGEGLDSTFVSEVVHLNPASVNNSNNQENGRAARYLPGVTGNINFDAGSGYAKAGYIGAEIMRAMDELPASDEPCDTCGKLPCACDPGDPRDLPELPDEPPSVILHDVRLTRVDSGDPGVQLMAKVLKEGGVSGINYGALLDPACPEWNKVIDLHHTMRMKQAEAFNEKATVLQWQENVKSAVSNVTGRACRMLLAGSQRVASNFAGDIKKRINTRKKIECGAIDESVDTCKRHYAWLKKLEQKMIADGRVPQWLQ